MKNLLESDLPDKPEREGLWPQRAEVTETHEERDEGPANQGVAYPSIEGHLRYVPGEHRGLVEDKEAGQQNVEIAGETPVLQFYQWSEIDLNLKLSIEKCFSLHKPSL